MECKDETETSENAKPREQWPHISLPKALVARIDACFPKLGYRSRAEYARIAILKQLGEDEHRTESRT